MTFYQQVRSMKKSILAKFQKHIISIDGVMKSQIVRHDVNIWWRNISFKNVGIALKLFRLFDPVVAIIWKFWEAGEEFLGGNQIFLDQARGIIHKNDEKLYWKWCWSNSKVSNNFFEYFTLFEAISKL